MDQTAPSARLPAQLRRRPDLHALSAEADPVALRRELRGEVAANDGGRVDGGVSGHVESGGVRR